MHLDKLREQLVRLGLDGLLITDKINRRYLCGFTGSNGLLLVTLDQLYLFVDGRYTQQVRQQTSGVKICEIPVGERIEQVISSYINGKTIGFEEKTISYQTFKQYQQVFTQENGQLIATQNLVEQLRMVKSPKEITAIKRAATIADQTLETILPLIRVGMTELEVANEIDYQSKKLGSEGPAFETIVASGVRTALPHAHASQKKIQANELIMIDFGAIYQGYYSDITRTFAFGTVADQIKKTYQQVLTAQKQAIQAVSFEKSLGDIDQYTRKQLEKDHLAKYFSHNLGHGIGLSCHEYPSLMPNEAIKIQKNMTFTIEPGVYLAEADFGIRIEDDIVVTEDGRAEIMTKFTKEWMTIDCNR